MIANTGANTEYLNSDSLNVSATTGDFTTDDGPFFANAPPFARLERIRGGHRAFRRNDRQSVPDAFTSCSGLLTILGGADGGSSDILTDPSVAFSVSAESGAPEPSTSILILAGFIACALVRRLKF